MFSFLIIILPINVHSTWADSLTNQCRSELESISSASKLFYHYALHQERQIRGGIEDIFFFIENICCDLSLELSHRDGSNEGSQNMFIWRNMKNYP